MTAVRRRKDKDRFRGRFRASACAVSTPARSWASAHRNNPFFGDIGRLVSSGWTRVTGANKSRAHVIAVRREGLDELMCYGTPTWRKTRDHRELLCAGILTMQNPGLVGRPKVYGAWC